MLQLLHTRDVLVFVASFIHIVRAPVSVEQLERADFLVDRVHEFFESLKVRFKLLDQVLAIFVESSVEQLITDGLNLTLNFGLGLWVLVELGAEALRVDVVLKLYDVEHFSMEGLERIFELVVLRAHLLE